MLKRLLTAFITTIISVASAQPILAAEDSSANKPVRDKWALIVGVSSFQNSSVPQLKYAVKDAQDFRNYLVNEAHFAPDHVRLLLDEKATQRRVLSELGNKFLARVAQPDDLVVLFFSSHGSPSQADLRGKNFVVAYDSDPEDLFTTGIEMDKIIESIQARILSERVLLVLDACHSGAVHQDGKGIGRGANFDAEALAQGSGQMVICSSLPDQQSWESKRYQNGIFTRHLLDGLRNNNGQNPLGRTFQVLKNNVSNEVKEDYGKPQEPVLKSKWNGNDLVLSASAAAPQAVPVAVQEILEPDSTFQPTAVAVSTSVPTVSSVPNAHPIAPSAPRTISQENWRKGVDLYNRGDFASAADILSLAVKTAPAKTQGEAHYYLANAYSKLNKNEKALAAFKEAFKYLPAGKKADYCLQLISYYSAARPSSRPTETRASAITTGNVITPVSSASKAFGSSVTSIPPEIITKVRSTLPRITVCRTATPTLSQLLGWSLQDKAAYLNEANDRLSRARDSLREAEDLLIRAKSAGASLVPNSRAYGESEESFGLRVNAGQMALNEILSPYITEIDLRSKRLADEETILQTCQASYNSLYRNVYGAPSGAGITTTTPIHHK